MQASIHLTFNGECEAAFKLYERTLGATIGFMLTYGSSPAAGDVPSEWRDKIVHASVTMGGQVFSGADVRPEEYEKPRGFYVLLGVDSPAEAERIFGALAEGGAVQMPLQKTFWSPSFGVLVDRFGTPWEISARGDARLP
jgi:PhnB protein